jgi:hypothetical protein
MALAVNKDVSFYFIFFYNEKDNRFSFIGLCTV